MSVPVWKKGLGLQRIHEVRICHEFRWIAKHLASIKTAYARAPYFADHLPFIEKTYQARFETLIELNITFIRYIFRQIGIETEIRLLSELGVQAAGSRLPVEICRRLGASTYLAQRAVAKYLDFEAFQQEGFEVQLIPPRLHLSPAGALLFPTCRPSTCSSIAAPKAHDIMLGG